ncbi:MAG: ATP-dependent DNA ligase [Candidatus Dormibacteria bacterium]
MSLPVNPPLAPMLAKPAAELPRGEGWLYEPKWDGFRCVVFRDGEHLELASRSEKPLTRYFPELREPLLQGLPQRCVLDGEVVISTEGGLDFDALLQRIHPAESRVSRLAQETPASLVAFDLLAQGDHDLRTEPLWERRRQLAELIGAGEPRLRLTPQTDDPAVAADWFSRFEGAGLDGVIAKRRELLYVEGRRVMVKVKHQRTADCVVAGFRWHKDGLGVGSLLLGLYDQTPRLQHLGITSSFTAERRRELVAKLEPYQLEDGEDHPWVTSAAAAGERRPGTPSRWTAKRDLSFVPLRPELVCEVAYDHLQGDRFRHGTTFRRWRPDRDPRSCSYSQLEVVVPAELAQLFS